MNFGLIADGNRRWAKTHQKKTSEGHMAGFLAIKDIILPTLRDHSDFDSITIYAFSTENWKRSPLEVKNLMDLFTEVFETWTPQLTEEQIKIVAVGRRDRLPKKLIEKIQSLEAKSKNFKKFTIYLCLDYGGRDEIIRGVQKIFKEAGSQKSLQKPNTESQMKILQNLDENIFGKNLEIPDLDLLYRPGSEIRISNFCLWQAAYAELFFEEKCLPDIRKKDVLQLISDFKQRKQRRGK